MFRGLWVRQVEDPSPSPAFQLLVLPLPLLGEDGSKRRAVQTI